MELFAQKLVATGDVGHDRVRPGTGRADDGAGGVERLAVRGWVPAARPRAGWAASWVVLGEPPQLERRASGVASGPDCAHADGTFDGQLVSTLVCRQVGEQLAARRILVGAA